jgi:hypothetical protein
MIPQLSGIVTRAANVPVMARFEPKYSAEIQQVSISVHPQIFLLTIPDDVLRW